jgi:ferrous iron transport protein A
MTTNLAKLVPGDRAKILSIGAIGPMKRRLMDMGLLPGEAVKVEKVAPLGDPIEITVKSYNLSLRKNEAEGIAVEVLK